MPRIKAILFDNDGVLVDTEELYYQATRKAMASLGIELSPQEHERINMTEGRSTLDIALARGVPQEEVEAVRLKRNEDYLETLRNAGNLAIPGVREELEALKPGRILGIVTSCMEPHFKLVHSKAGLLELFDFVIGHGDYEHHKPHPEPYLKGLARSGASPEETLAVEDAVRGVESAVAAGLHCVAIPRGVSAHGDFSKAWRRLPSLAAFRQFVESLG